MKITFLSSNKIFLILSFTFADTIVYIGDYIM